MKRQNQTIEPINLSPEQIAWWQVVVSDPNFPAICMAIQSCERHKAGIQETAHAQTYVAGYRDCVEDMRNAPFEIISRYFDEQSDPYVESTYAEEPDLKETHKTGDTKNDRKTFFKKKQ